MAKSNVAQSVYSILFENMCALGGGTYRGMLPSFRDKNNNLIEAVCLFDSPTTSSTLGIAFSKMSADAVRKRIENSNAQFEQFADKATMRVFHQFSSRNLKPNQTHAAAPAQKDAVTVALTDARAERGNSENAQPVHCAV